MTNSCNSCNDDAREIYLFEALSMDLKSLGVFFFDVDGVLSVGKEKPRYLGGKEVVKWLKESGKQTFVLTNYSTQAREAVHRKLTKLGFGFKFGEILTSGYLTATYLTDRFGSASFFLIGEEGLRRELEAAGHVASAHPQVVVVGLDRKLSYEKLDKAWRCLHNGAALVGGYGGSVYMSATGPALSAGPIIKALESASGKRAVVIGKPSPRIFRLALQLAHEKPSRAVMIGDQIETDILGARRAGVHTVLVLTGVETRESIARSKIKPDAVIANVDGLRNLL